jgi:hypothetical protein
MKPTAYDTSRFPEFRLEFSVAQNGMALQFAGVFREDCHVVRAASQQDVRSLQHASIMNSFEFNGIQWNSTMTAVHRLEIGDSHLLQDV